MQLYFRVVERGRVKCGQYWPLEEGRTEQHGYFLVRNTHIQVFQDFKLSCLELYNTQVSEGVRASELLFPDAAAAATCAVASTLHQVLQC